MKQALVKLHIGVFLAGFTAILGRLIELNAVLLVWYRIFFTVVFLSLTFIFSKKSLRIPVKQMFNLGCIGFIIALHWVFFYASIKYANVSVALVCFASTSLFTALLEPLIVRSAFKRTDLLLGLLSLAGIYLIFHFDAQYRLGIFLGIISAILSALFSVLTKKNVHHIASKQLMFFQLSGGLLLLTLLLPIWLYYFPEEKWIPSLTDLFWLLLLALLCTVLAMNLMLQALKKVSAFTQNLTLNLEPVYGISMAFIVFNEGKNLPVSFYLGLCLIAVSVALQMFRIVTLKKNKAN
ncbi:MAG: EamA family transporter [Sphingobacteriia bacterium]|nr:EamA family transporter [Sphingobacteriia bacterium]